MKIVNVQDKKHKCFMDVGYGECFGALGMILIRTEEISTESGKVYNSVCLHDGSLWYIDCEFDVTVEDAKVVII